MLKLKVRLVLASDTCAVAKVKAAPRDEAVAHDLAVDIRAAAHQFKALRIVRQLTVHENFVQWNDGACAAGTRLLLGFAAVGAAEVGSKQLVLVKTSQFGHVLVRLAEPTLLRNSCLTSVVTVDVVADAELID